MPICWPLSSFLVSHHSLQFRKALVKMRKLWRRGRNWSQKTVYSDGYQSSGGTGTDCSTFMISQSTNWNASAVAIPSRCCWHPCGQPSQPSCLDLIGEISTSGPGSRPQIAKQHTTHEVLLPVGWKPRFEMILTGAPSRPTSIQQTLFFGAPPPYPVLVQLPFLPGSILMLLFFFSGVINSYAR